MASGTSNKGFGIRPAAVLTNSEVAGTAFDLNNAWGSKCGVLLNFTLGSLTNATIKYYGSLDGTTYFPVGQADSVLTASGISWVPMPANLVGLKWLRVSATGTGTVTGSSLTIDVRYLRKGSQ